MPDLDYITVKLPVAVELLEDVADEALVPLFGQAVLESARLQIAQAEIARRTVSPNHRER